MDALVLKNKKGTFAEIITDFDFGSFKYEYEKNNERSISFTLYKTSNNADIFDHLVNEAFIEWQGQLYVTKSTSIKYDGLKLTNEVVAKHIFMEFQKHYIQKDMDVESESSDEDEDDSTPTMTLEQYLDFGFKGNKLGFEYEIRGQFQKRVPVDDLGGKNGVEHVSEGAEIFNYIYFADNKKYYIYDEATFYEMSDIPLIYLYNSSEATVTTTTTDIFNYIQGYGKKKTKKETQNYNPIKPKDLNYSGSFIKEGTWHTEKVGASYTKTFECKHGNETLEWTLKKMSKGGILDVYLDGEKIDTYECYSKNAKSEKIVIAQDLAKGKRTFKAIFKGAKKGVDYKKSEPCMYVGTEKSTVLNLTAKLKGKDAYHTYADYTSPNYDGGDIAEAPTIFDDNITNKDELRERLKEELNDQPTVEVSTNYLGSVEDKQYITNDDIKENNKIRFIHQPLGFNLDLKVVKITVSHPLLDEPVEVDFSNSPKDILKMQQQTTKAIRKFNKQGIGGSNIDSSFSMPQLASDSIGSVLMDE